MKHKLIADRKPELEFFRKMLAGKTDARIMLIQAASGWGKTDLLTRFAHECPDDACIVRLDLKGAEKGIAEVLRVFREKLGADALMRFNAALVRLQSSVNITNNTALAGTIDIDVALNVDEQTRKTNLALLETAFFDDLRAVCLKYVIIFDTFEKAPLELQNWISSVFLRNLVRIPDVCIVIGGQSVPAHTSEEWEDYCERRPLREIHDVDEWHTFAQESQFPFPHEAVKAIVLACAGNPKAIREMFEQVALGWSK